MADTKALRPPRLPELGLDLLRLTRWQVVRIITLPFLASSGFWLLAAAGHWIAAVLSLVVLSFVTYGSTSHDLGHGNLGLRRPLNDLLLSAIELPAVRSDHAYHVVHLTHHDRVPHAAYVDARAARMSLPRALLEGMTFPFRIYAWSLRNPRGRRGWIVGEGLAVLAIVLAAVAALPWTILPAAYVGLMVAGGWTIPLVTSYLPHDPEAADVLQQTRVFRGVVARIVAVGHLYHLEHHLYPAVPHQNWPRLAARLDPWLAAAGIKPVRFGF